ncbi:YkgJ family cysteine cluster protein [Cupriavidus pinatubonensis]|uniref:YkgJ family cysteine cluster protein n=1 Tax=Cupriavidus pinatubonensis TaxID=248026 RepID=UPI0011298B77|nr:YkgJ family cysteine cluster protein [Cupriavidus pinatubonensis]TPQ39697.1 zinc/iron-chelating domain-containing protein [Cupriavidus pinatubonensis]
MNHRHDCLSHLACREGCGACCIAPSIASPLPGKPAGVRCAQLLPDARCAVFGRPDRPAFCSSLQPSAEMCGDSRESALRWLTQLEILTAPGGPGA